MKKQTLFIVTYNVSVRGSWPLHLFKQTEYYLDDMNICEGRSMPRHGCIFMFYKNVNSKQRRV